MVETYKEYSEINSQIQTLEARKKELAEKIISQFHKEKKQNDKTEFGNFFMVSRPTYAFSDAVNNLESQVKALRKEEIEKGVAVVKSNKPSLVLR